MKIDKKIDNLFQLVIKMADLVTNNINESLSCYLDNKASIEIDDDVINNYEINIGEKCINIITKERPYAKDLRIVLGILKVVSDLERLGDYAYDIIDYTKKLEVLEQCQINEVKELVTEVLNMVNQSTHCFVNLDVEEAEQIILEDDVIDELFIKVISTLINLNQEKKLSSKFVIYTTLVVKYLERIADHSTNVAEWVIYINNGDYKGNKVS